MVSESDVHPVRLASRRRRFLAYLVDVIPFVGALFILAYGFTDFDQVLHRYFTGPRDNEELAEFLHYRNWIRDLALIAYVLYSWIADSTRFQGTAGKQLLGIRVVDENGDRLDLRKSAVRNYGKILSAIPLFLGFIWMFFRKDRRGWHDLMAGSYVVRE